MPTEQPIGMFCKSNRHGKHFIMLLFKFVEAAASSWQRTSSKEKSCPCMENLHVPGWHGMRRASNKTAWC
eukprot:3993702-Amphidinium_carterae.1